jgi:cytochrome c-type biogenesis protein
VTSLPVLTAGAPLATGLGDSFAQTAFSGSMALAIPVALIAGLVSFASPCVVPLVPGYVGFLGGLAGSQAGTQRAPSTQIADDSAASRRTSRVRRVWSAGRGRIFVGMTLFIAGFTFVFVVAGVATGALGVALAQWSDTVTRVLGVLVAVMGLAFMGAIPALRNEAKLHYVPNSGLLGAPILGFVFGLGWTPCLGPTLVAINSLALTEGSATRGAILAVAYSLGLGLPFLIIAVGLERSKKALGFMRKHRLTIMRIGGGMLLILGIAMTAGWWTALSNKMSIWIGYTSTVV